MGVEGLMAVHDYVVIGAGPAGTQLGYHLARAGRDHLVLEAGDTAGTFFRTFPRHRTLISNNKKHTGWSDPELRLRMDWNSVLADDGDPAPLFTTYSDEFFPAADDLVRYLSDYAAHAVDAGMAIRYGTRVVRIDRPEPDGPFELTDAEGGAVGARRLVVAAGFSRPYLPDIPGLEHAEQYVDVPVDPAGFTDQRVLVIGKGNSAFETADNLIAHAAVIHVAGHHSVKLAWRTHFVGHLRAVNNNLLDLYQLKSQHAILDGSIRRIVPDGDGYLVTVAFARANEVTKDIRYDRVISCTGFRFDASLFTERCRPALTINDRFPDQTDTWESVNVPGLHFAGTLTQMRDFKKTTSGFIHGFRYNTRALHRILARRYEGEEWPHGTLTADPEALTDALLARANRSSALWQQFGFLCDLVALDGGTARHYQEVPVAHLPGSGLAPAEAVTLTLEYGPDHDRVDPFDIEQGRIRQDDAGRAVDSRYLHPVVRHWRAGRVAGEHHVAENLENDWTSPVVHREPLRAFLTAALAAGALAV
jgi:thioredoxin reductase